MMPLPDIFAAFKWWLVLMILGLITLPLAQLLLHRLPDRGYAFAKLIGLLIVSFVFWFFGSIGFLGNNLAGILFGVLVLVLTSIWAFKQIEKDGETISPVSWIRSNWKYVLAAELLFSAAFIFWTWARAQNPAISGTEKPMEFAFLNSIGRSPTFPPADPWLSGFAISYYYFGYVMSSVVGRLAAVADPLSYNLALVWLAAGTSLAAFGVVYNLVASGISTARRAALIAALAAGIALPLAGNMEILLELLHENGIGQDELWEWLDVRDLESPSVDTDAPRYKTGQWWWWRSSRVIHEYHLSGRAEDGLEPITEFPAFSFVLGDLHPHVLALPYAFLSLGLALAWWRRTEPLELDFRKWFTRQGLLHQIRAISLNDKVLILFTGLLLGGLSFLNTWDVLIHLFVIGGAIMLSQWRNQGEWSRGIFFNTATAALVLIVLAIILYLPFYIGFRSQAAPPFLLPMTMKPTRLTHFLIMFGMPLAAIVILLGSLLFNSFREPRNGGGPKLGLKVFFVIALLLVGLLLVMILLGIIVAASQDGVPRVINLGQELGVDLPQLPQSSSLGPRTVWALSAALALFPDFIAARVSSPFLILFLAFLIGSSIYLVVRSLDKKDDSDESEPSNQFSTLPFVLLLIITGSLLALVPEFVYLRDNFGQRLNTIFKFYYQSWVLFGVSALFAVEYLLRRFRLSGLLALAVYGAALGISLLFPYFSVQSRSVEYRGSANQEGRIGPTLDGLAFLERSDPGEKQAIEWFNRHVDGLPFILEAVGGQYSSFGRISSSTGLPTLLGWPGHEYQWRGSTPEPAEREIAVRTIYESPDLEETINLLNEYDVSYIIYGPRERSTYLTPGEEKFDQYFEIAFSSGGIKVYRWQPR